MYVSVLNFFSYILNFFFFFFSSRRRHTRWTGDWSSDVCSSDLRFERTATKSSRDQTRPGTNPWLHGTDRCPRAWPAQPADQRGPGKDLALWHQRDRKSVV